MIHYSCIGATGYVCGEVLRMMVNHPDGELVNVLDTYGVGDAISTHHPALRGFYDQTILDLTEENVRETARKSDVVMIQVPSGAVAKWAEIVLAEGSRIIDIGADIRFRDVKVWEKWYGDKHTNPQMTHDAVYSMPEMNRELAKGKKLIANPGCYPTASTLGLQPMLKTGHVVENTIVIDAKSGYTGAGRRPALNKLLTEAENNFCAYALYKDFYKDEPFVKVFPSNMPVQTKWAYGTNFVEMTPTFDSRTHRLIVSSVIDNIGKGAAGQAIQNMNLIMGLPETTGLMMPPMYP